MTTNSCAYEKFEGLPVWQIVSSAIDDLVQNRDLVEQTHRRYLVGLLIERLHEHGMLTKEALTKEMRSS